MSDRNQTAPIQADIRYLVPMTERATRYTYDPPPGIPKVNTRYEDRRVPIFDARRIAADLDLDRQGFALLRHSTAATDFDSSDQIKRVYYPECERLLLEFTGAFRVQLFDHTVRLHIPGADDRDPKAPRQPASSVHVDQTLAAGLQRARDVLPDEVDELLKHRLAIINIWRPLQTLLLDKPLALCDASTVADEDLIPTDLVYRDRKGETYSVTYNSAHRWYYVPAMSQDEAILIKCVDTAEDGRARFTPHMAITDPNTPADAQPRRSIEVRALCFFR